MTSWFPAPCIGSLQRDLDAEFPNRTEPDWIIGDPDHSARVSDHNPDESGMVHGIDIRLGGGLDVRRVLDAVIGDPRVWYVIHDGIIYSRTYGWEARHYTGASPHTEHIHVSVRYTTEAEQDTSKWGIRKVTPLPIDISEVRHQFRVAIGVEKGDVSSRASVRRVQKALNARTHARLDTDGIVGKKTVVAWKAWEHKHPGSGRESVPDRKSLGPLVQPKWKLVD